MDSLLEGFNEIFSMPYLISVIFLSYGVLKLIDYINKDRCISKLTRYLVTILVGAALMYVFATYVGTPVEKLLPTYFLAVYVYDIAIKWAIKKLDGDYRKE